MGLLFRLCMNAERVQVSTRKYKDSERDFGSVQRSITLMLIQSKTHKPNESLKPAQLDYFHEGRLKHMLVTGMLWGQRASFVI